FELQRLYQEQLAAQVADTRLAAHDRNAAAAVLAASRRLMGVMLRPDEEHRTWVFSDPHFRDEASVAVFGRPFRSAHHGDGYLLELWTHDVRDQDTVLCLGDVTIDRPPDYLIDHIRRRPGRKILVPGNHDHAHIRRLRRAFNEVAACAHLPGKPHLLLTHVPLDDVPAGCVNVHGHVHRKTSVDEHRINVCVEQIGYQPIPMADVRRLACRLNKAPLGGAGTTDLFIDWAKGWRDAAKIGAQEDDAP
ncbi:MAG: metallophosphoesterase, partial [Acidobacteria bacterium]|nr:metallophosphoesterase [Acidobacteriota bacterium]